MENIEEKENLSATEEVVNNHKALKAVNIIMFALMVIAFIGGCYFFGSFLLADEVGKAFIVLLIFIPLICLLVSLISLIVNAIGRKKLKLAKIFTIIDIVLVLLQVVMLILYFVLI